MEKKKTSSGVIRITDDVRVKIIRGEIEVRGLGLCNRKPVIKRLCKGQHINTATGEIIDDKVTTYRGESMDSLRHSNMQLMELIKENTLDIKKLLLVSLSYREKTLDTDKISYDFKQFMVKLRKSYTQFGIIDYIRVLEFYADKSGYHVHVILFFNYSNKNVFIPVADIEKLWKQGTVHLGQPKNKRDVYYYLTPHASNEITSDNEKMHTKALLQQELPAHQRLYDASRTIKKPVIFTDTYENVKNHLKENGYEYKSEALYPSPMQGLKGNTLYHAKEYYEKPQEPPTKPRRKPI